MSEAFDGIEEIPHPEEAAVGSGRRARHPARFARDSPLEGDGFELLVPRQKSRGFPQHSWHCVSAELLNDTT